MPLLPVCPGRDLRLRLSNRIENLKSSLVRKILSVIDKPGMISFASGLPALESMPELDLAGLPRNFFNMVRVPATVN